MRMSAFIRDPIVRAAFERAERDYGQTFAIPDEPLLTLDGGAAELVDRKEQPERLPVATRCAALEAA